jgi:hypothetical protein
MILDFNRRTIEFRIDGVYIVTTDMQTDERKAFPCEPLCVAISAKNIDTQVRLIVPPKQLQTHSRWVLTSTNYEKYRLTHDKSVAHGLGM